MAKVSGKQPPGATGYPTNLLSPAASGVTGALLPVTGRG